MIPQSKLRQTVEKAAALIDQRPLLVLPVWIVTYFIVFWRAAGRPLWYDELFSYYTSLSPNLERFIYCILHVDLNPPLQYFFMRLSMDAFGNTPFAARLPFLVAFLVASLVTFRIVWERWGGALGLVSLGLLWTLGFSRYAVEARPYSFQLAFFSLAAYCWLRAAERSSNTGKTTWTWMHTGLMLSLAALILTHCFSPTLALALLVGELVRTRVEKQFDRRMWFALLAPLSLVAVYIPLVRNAQAMVYPAAFQANPFTILIFYIVVPIPVLPVVVIALLLMLRARVRPAQPPMPPPPAATLKPHEKALWLATFLSPSLIIGYALWSGVPFWVRYGIGVILPGAIFLTAFFARASRRNQVGALALSVLVLGIFASRQGETDELMQRFQNVSTAHRAIHPELPFVAASGLAFMELDHNESNQFTSRLFYLTDRVSAIRYSQASIFEGIPILKRTFPVRGNVMAYQDFVASHHRFLVFGTPGYPEDWLLDKLKDDGAHLELVLDGKFGYRDQKLFLVTLGKAPPVAD